MTTPCVDTGMIRSGLSAVTLAITALLTTAASSAADQTPEQGARYDYKVWECTVWPDRFRLKVAHRLTIYNPRGEQYAALSITENGYSSLKKVSARVIGPDGKVMYSRDKKDLTKICGYGETELYIDVCSYQTALEAPQFPYSVEYEYEIETGSLFFWRGKQFQDLIPVDSACYTLWFGGDVSYRHKITGSGVFMGTVADKRGEGARWESRNLPALEAVEHVPPGIDMPAGVAIVPTTLKLGKYAFAGESWVDIGLWYRDLAAEQYLPVAPDQTLDSGISPQEIVRRCYDEVIGKVRYVAVEIGVGGWQPDAANRTEVRGYGDCKDVTTLLVSKLRQHGIEAYPALALTRSAGRTDVAFPGFAFNHVIAMAVLGSDTVYMDPTCETCPFGDLPQGDEDIDILVVTDQGGVLRHTPPSAAEDNLVVRRTSVHIGTDLLPVVVSEHTITGNYAQYLRRHLASLDNDDTRRFVYALFPGGEKLYRLISYEFKNLDDIYGPVMIAVEVQRLKPLDRIGKSLYVGPFVFEEPAGYEKVDLTNRRYPLNLYYPDSDLDSVTITWDSGLAVDSIMVPKADSAFYTFADIAVNSRRQGDSVAVAVTHAYRAYAVDTSQFAEFEAFRSRARELTDQYVKLIVK